MIEEPTHCRANCAHLDCAEIRLPKCIRCKKKVNIKDIFMLMVARTSQPVHNKCLTAKDLGD
jgi:hypothetical protein